MQATRFLHKFQTVDLGHQQIGQNEVRQRRREQRKSLGTVGSLDDLAINLALQQAHGQPAVDLRDRQRQGFSARPRP